jgi:2-polyprenyl-6-methoxyphenol hydroxylase-like FAD-dependent oxidoreductase
MTVQDVLVVGAGPAGLALAHELALAGASVTVLERLADRIEQTKGGAIQPRTAELLDTRGLLAPVQAAALARPAVGGHFAGLPVPLDCGSWQTATPYPISLPQWRFEEILEAAAIERGAVVWHGVGVDSVEQDADGVTVRAGDRVLRAKYLVACDGAHSTVRKLLELPFPGRPGTYRAVLADVTLTAVSAAVPVQAGHFSDLTKHANGYWGMIVPLGGQRFRFTAGDTTGGEMGTSAEALQTALTAIYGEPTTLGEIHTLSRFTDATRQLESYRHGRILFAGDAAHIHPPYGGQGLNLGVQDGINLGWKLAATLAGWAPDGLLDSYQTERHPVAARVLHHTSAQRVLINPLAEPDVLALRDIVTDLMRLPAANAYLAGMMSGLDAAGRVPDTELGTADGPVRSGRPLLVDTGDTPGLAEFAAGWADRVDLVHVTAPAGFGSVLLRPDAVAAWTAGDGSPADALAATFGAPVPTAVPAG